MKVKIFDLKFDSEFRREFYEKCEKIFDEAYLTDHTYVRAFEERFSEWSGCPHNVAVTSGTHALVVALRALQLQPGDEVLMQTNTFIACWSAVRQCGLTPVLLDIEPDYLGPDLTHFQNSITPRTKALIITHIGGLLTPDLPQIQKICRQNGLFLIEDCAHAHGSQLNATPAGAWGDIGCFSFHLTKVMTCGEGGMLTTRSPELADKIRRIKSFGRSAENPHVFDSIGSNFKMSELAAAFLLTEEKRSAHRIERRRQIAEIYREKLDRTRWKIFWPSDNQNCSFYKAIALSPIPRPELQAALHPKQIQLPNGVYYTPLHRQPIVRKISGIQGEFPVADNFCDRHVCLPCYPELSTDQLNYVLQSLAEITG